MKELHLLNYKRVVELLDYIARTNVYFDAIKVELVLCRVEIEEIKFNIIDFLAPFNGLKDLFLMFDSDYTNEYYAEMILHYRDTLRRLVFYRRHYCMAEKAPY